MKTCFKNLVPIPVLMAALGVILSGQVTAQSFTTLHSFTGTSDGANPVGELILSGNTLYGTAEYGGSSGKGTVFAVNTDGTGFTNLHSFSGLDNYSINSDGAHPRAPLVLLNKTLYGTANAGGSW